MDSNLNHRVIEHHKKCGLFSDLHYGFRSSRPILDLLTVVFDRITTAFDRSVTWYITVALDISKGFDRVWHAGLLQKLISYGISAWLFIFFLSFVHNSRLQFLKAPFLCLPSSCHTLMTFMMMLSVILLSILKILLSILSVIKHLWLGVIRQLELVSELKSDLLEAACRFWWWKV